MARSRLPALLLFAILSGSSSDGQEGAGLPVPGAPAAPAAAPAPVAEDEPEATVDEAEGPIAVRSLVPDAAIREKLARLLPRLRGVRAVEVDVEDGVVTLTGHVEDAEARDRLRSFALRVEGVNLVLNQVRTDAQVLTARQLLEKRLGRFRDLVAQSWLAFLAAVVVLIGSILAARLFSYSSDRLLSPLFPGALLRSVVASVVGLAIVLTGVYAALEVLGVARAVLSVVGLAGAVALALSFAFRDFAENFIASLLLGVRRPFRMGDFVEVAGQSGVVRALNTRATILLTLEGHRVQIPNATVFKNVLINRTASEAIRSNFDVLIDPAASAVEAQRAIASSLARHDGILAEPPPRTLIEALEPAGVRLRTYFWLPNRGVDALKLQSDARLRAMVALREAGIAPPQTSLSVRLVDGPSAASAVRRAPSTAPPVAPDRARPDLRLDTEAADASCSAGDAQGNEIDQALTVARDLGDEEANNLLADGR